MVESREKARPVRWVGDQEYVDQYGVRHFTWFNDWMRGLLLALQELERQGKIEPGGRLIFLPPDKPPTK